uniref:CCHC-type domain-containing protein n=1 Tax=Quercus lobata TaxID=97700 RepID=A0A7N2L855_QUELO
MLFRSVTFSKQPFWIQVWSLPFDLINEEAGSDIGRSIGELVEVDYEAFNSDRSKFLQIRVEVPLDKPLRWGGPVISLKGETSRVAFRYEHLVGWCFNCGRIGHDKKECPLPIKADNGDRPYREWLKAGISGETG